MIIKGSYKSKVANHMNWDNSDPKTNGEYFLLKMLGYQWKLILDIGANRGEYTEQLKIHSPRSKIISFEPNPKAASHIKKSRRVKIELLAVGEKNGTVGININNNDDTQSSTYRQNAFTTLKKFHQVGIDSYLLKNKIKKVDFVKIDTEGHELSILSGAKIAIKTQSIEIIQFEYGGTYKDAGTKLEMIYKLLSDKYIICHILPGGLLPIGYSKDIETYRYSNWLAISRNIFGDLYL